MCAVGQMQPNLARLPTHGGRGELRFRFALLHTVRAEPEAAPADPYEVLTSFYQYRILEHEEREIVVYDCTPAGISPVRTPHLHLPIAGSVRLNTTDGGNFVSPTEIDFYIDSGYHDAYADGGDNDAASSVIKPDGTMA